MIGLVLLIAGIVLWFATSLVTIGVILTIAGGAILAVQIIFFIVAAIAAWRMSKKIRNGW